MVVLDVLLDGLLIANGQGVWRSSSDEDKVGSGHVVSQDFVDGFLNSA